jgi:hypothetical protein
MIGKVKFLTAATLFVLGFVYLGTATAAEVPSPGMTCKFVRALVDVGLVPSAKPEGAITAPPVFRWVYQCTYDTASIQNKG